MLAFVLRRMLWAIPTIWLAFTLAFLALHEAQVGELKLILEKRPADQPPPPAGPIYQFECPGGVQYVPNEIGCPLYVQYGVYLKELVTFHWESATTFDGDPIGSAFASTFPVTARLGAASFGIAVLLGMPLGLFAALNRGGWLDHLVSVCSTTAYAVPAIVLAILMLMLAANYVPFFPVLWEGDWQSYVLPSVALGISAGGFLALLSRASVLDVLFADYVRTARAKGLRDRAVVGRHVLRNAVLPVLAAMGQTLALLLAGSMLVEWVFQIPGMGKMVFDAIRAQDFPLILATTTLYTALVVCVNLLADIARALADPRVREVG